MQTNSKVCSAHFGPRDFARTHIFHDVNVLSQKAIPRPELTPKWPLNINRKTMKYTRKSTPDNVYVISEVQVSQYSESDTAETVQKVAPNSDHNYTIKIESGKGEENKSESTIDCNSCRICLKTENLASLFMKFYIEKRSYSYAELIEEITTLKVNSKILEPQFICLNSNICIFRY